MCLEHKLDNYSAQDKIREACTLLATCRYLLREVNQFMVGNSLINKDRGIQEITEYYRSRHIAVYGYALAFGIGIRSPNQYRLSLLSTQ